MKEKEKTQVGREIIFYSAQVAYNYKITGEQCRLLIMRATQTNQWIIEFVNLIVPVYFLSLLSKILGIEKESPKISTGYLNSLLSR